MEPRTLLDTDVLSGIMRKTTTALNRARAYLADHPRLTLSLVTRFEILRGLKARQATAQLAAFDLFCNNNEVLPVTDGVIIRASDIYAELHVRGQLIPDADILMAVSNLNRNWRAGFSRRKPLLECESRGKRAGGRLIVFPHVARRYGRCRESLFPWENTGG